LGIAIGLLLLPWVAYGAGTSVTASVYFEGRQVELPVKVFLPEGKGPFPAVIILHTCSGIIPGTTAEADWGEELAKAGYVGAVPDSFRPRGFPDGVCSDVSRIAQMIVGRADDVYVVAKALTKLPEVDPNRIGMMGGSQGARTVLYADGEPTAGSFEFRYS